MPILTVDQNKKKNNRQLLYPLLAESGEKWARLPSRSVIGLEEMDSADPLVAIHGFYGGRHRQRSSPWYVFNVIPIHLYLGRRTMAKVTLSKKQREEILKVLQARFEKNTNRHKGFEWAQVQAKLEANPEKLWSLNEMERTGGEPDVFGHDKKTDEYIFYDSSAESPKGRRSLCYDREALESRKQDKPKDNAIDMAVAMGIELLTEEQYRELQQLGKYDTKTSSWVKTPSAIRKLGGALFCDRRFDTVFLYHNGAESYYAARGFRGSLRI